MELVTDVLNNQLYLYLPVALVLVGAILVFTFGFKSAEQPPFDKLSTISEDKRASSKKRKSKDKKVAANGTAVSVAEKPTKEKNSPNKEAPITPKQAKNKDAEKRKIEVPKPNKSTVFEDHSNKKNIKAKSNEKPSDFDDGNWETVPIKNDKKTKKQDSPAKKANKSKKAGNENLTKPDVDHNKDDNKENIKKLVEELVKKDVEKDVPVIEEKKSKKETVKIEKEVVVSPPAVVEPLKDEKLPDLVQEKVVDAEVTTKGGVAFDELGDVWSDPKAVKKSKKKSRRDN